MLRRALVFIPSRLGSSAVYARGGQASHLPSLHFSCDLLGSCPCPREKRCRSLSTEARKSIYRMISSATGPEGASKEVPSSQDTPKSR